MKSDITKRLAYLRNRFRHAGIRLAAGKFEVFNTAPSSLHVWKQVDTLDEAVELANQLVLKHDNATLNVWSPDQKHVYQVKNEDGKPEVTVVPPSAVKKQLEQMKQEKAASCGRRHSEEDEYEEEYEEELPESLKKPIFRPTYRQHPIPYQEMPGSKYSSTRRFAGYEIFWMDQAGKNGAWLAGLSDGSGEIQVISHDKNLSEEELVQLLEKKGVKKEDITVSKQASATTNPIKVGNGVYRRVGEPAPDVGFDGFVGVYEPKSKAHGGEEHPQWVMERMRERGRAPLPVVTDEDVMPVNAKTQHRHADRWVTFTRRTDFPKLQWLMDQLNEAGIPNRINGQSFHAPILEIPEYELDAAWEILDPVDDLDDDDPMFTESSVPYSPEAQQYYRHLSSAKTAKRTRSRKKKS